MHILTINYLLLFLISYIYCKGPHQHGAAFYIFRPFQINDVCMYVCILSCVARGGNIASRIRGDGCLKASQ